MKSAAGRVLGLALVMMLVMSVVGLAASQTFINKTGKTVTGIKIEFSRSVLITRHDSVFPDQNPSGRSAEFTFDGGKLRNLGRFAVSWMPSSGKVTDYEWIEKAQPSGEQQSSKQQNEGSSLPDPNTPPILYGNDYPGPNEPKYQPAPDEEIWLTDLDGHGDIYDNDGIKVNYAPGFDVSQITKIEVYRNGVKLRFLPETFEVLTNAQMKTFDGNPAEHSPASNHTDHAIMGYEYEFKISTADHLWILKKTVKSGFRWRPKEVWANLGISWHWNGIDAYPFDRTVQFLNYLKEDGFTGISIVLPYYIMTPYSSNVFEQYTVDPSVTNWDITTPTLSELRRMLKAADVVGLDKRVIGCFYVSQSYKDAHPDTFVWQGMINPKNPPNFFENYTSLLEKIIPLLNKYNVKALIVLEETYVLYINYSYWIEKMLDALSGKFDGDLGIDISGNNILENVFSGFGLTWKDAINKMTFWSWKSLDGKKLRDLSSCGTPSVETQKDQRVSVMAKHFVEFWRPLLDYVAAKYSNPLYGFGEIDVYNADGQSLGAAYWHLKNKVMDEQERADFILAALKGSKELVVSSLNLWGDFAFGDSRSLQVGITWISTGHYGAPASPMYRVFTSIIRPEEE